MIQAVARLKSNIGTTIQLKPLVATHAWDTLRDLEPHWQPWWFQSGRSADIRPAFAVFTIISELYISVFEYISSSR